MKGSSIDVAIRSFLGAKFRLPGESQRIDRMMESFANYYHENNPGSIFENTEGKKIYYFFFLFFFFYFFILFSFFLAVHLLAFAIIMLNTDLHNPAIKKKMTKIEFKGRVLGIKKNNFF
jgi:Sec7-like guanine-nucleotide exchange factor